MYLSEFIGRHLKHNLEVLDCDTICKMCGKKIIQGVNRKDIIKSSFTDYQYLKYDSDFMCPECASLIAQIQVNGKSTWLRNFSFICTETTFLSLKREEIWDWIFVPPTPPFVFVVTYTNKKQIAFKAAIQEDNKTFKIFTDKGEVEITPSKLNDLTEILRNWYTIVPNKADSKLQPTYFNKSEILSGGKNLKNIENYGINRYVNENNFLNQYRNTPLLKLLVFALNKY